MAKPGDDSLWFDGHFPGAPVLPGIAQLAMVSDLLRWHAQERGGTVSVSSLSKVRFRQLIRPGDTLTVEIRPDEHDAASYKFKIIANGQLACNGTVRTAAQAG